MEQTGKRLFEERVRALEAFGHRGSGTGNEERAADYLVQELKELGIDGQKESFIGSSSLGARVLIHVVMAICGLALIWIHPIVTVLLGFLVIISFYVEMNTKYKCLGFLLERSRAHNAVGRIPAGGDKPPGHRIILCAHIDTQRTGLMWQGEMAGPIAKMLQKAPGPMKSPLFLVVAAFCLQPFLGLLAFFWSPDAVIIVFSSLFFLIYGIAGFLLADWAKGKFVPGACDNATGAAAVLELARGWRENPPEDIELVALLCGCEETGALGAAAWLDAHREELEKSSNLFLVIDTLGYGAPRFLGGEHTLAANPLRYPKELLDLCKEVAKRQGLKNAGPYVLPTFTDGIAFMNRGISGISVLTFEEDVTMPNYHQMGDTSDNMDFEIGWQAVLFCRELLTELRINGPYAT